MSSPFRRFLDTQGFVVLDGGFATALEATGYTLDTPLWSARALIDAPRSVVEVHLSYLEAGADCISTAGYQASFEGFEAAGLRREEAETALRRAVALAVEARTSFWSGRGRSSGRLEPLVAASVGPYGAFLADGSEYDGRYSVGRETLEAFHGPRLDVLADAGADLIAFETVPSVVEAEVIASLLSERPGTPAWISFSCRDAETLWDGTRVGEAVMRVLDASGSAASVAAVGVNCVAPEHVTALIERIRPVSDLPVLVYPNSGENYRVETRSWAGPSAKLADHVADWVSAGAHIVGGCCRVGSGEIRGLRLRLEQLRTG